LLKGGHLNKTKTQRTGSEVVRWTKMPRGGHFAAMEQPKLLADDIRSFFRPLRK